MKDIEQNNDKRGSTPLISNEDYINFLNMVGDRIWFVLGSLISADAFFADDNERSITHRQDHIEILQKIVDNVSKTNISDDMKEKISSYAKKGISLLNDEINEIKNYNS